MSLTLKDLRLSRKLTLQQVADHLTEAGVYPKATTAHAAGIESRGTDKYTVLAALAQLYSMSVDEIAQYVPKK